MYNIKTFHFVFSRMEDVQTVQKGKDDSILKKDLQMTYNESISILYNPSKYVINFFNFFIRK